MKLSSYDGTLRLLAGQSTFLIDDRVVVGEKSNK